MSVHTVRVGMGQTLVQGGAVAENLERAVRMIARAADESCDVVVLPECLNCGWTWPETPALATRIPGAHSDLIAAAAKNCGIYVVAGLAERARSDLYNAAILVSPDGVILALHRKINELEIGRGLYAVGDRLSVTRTAIGTIGVTICADNFPDSLALGHSLGRMGCQLLLSPCAWAVDADHDNESEPYGGLWIGAYEVLARRHGMGVVGVSNVGPLAAGPWSGRKCIGSSLAMGPDGSVLARGPYGELAQALVVVEIDIRPPAAWGPQ